LGMVMGERKLTQWNGHGLCPLIISLTKYEDVLTSASVNFSSLRQILERNSLNRNDLFWFMVSAHGWLTLLFWAQGKTNQHRREHDRAELLTSWWPRNRQNDGGQSTVSKDVSSMIYFL
jgi:hypothetical protein